MKDILYEIVDSAVKSYLADKNLEPENNSNWVVETPRRPEHGDYSSNVAMVMAKTVRKSPRDLAGELIAYLGESKAYVEKVEVVPPGFINFFLNKDVLLENLKNVIRQGERYGRSETPTGKKVQVEFVSANPTGPLHVGHGRGAALGDALANVLEAAGWEVSREYYVNDVGRQMDTLGRSVFFRYLEVAGKDVSFPEDHYQGDYIRSLAEEIRAADGDRWLESSEEEALPRFRGYAKDRILDGIKQDLDDFGVRYDVWFSEAQLYENNSVEKILADLEKKDFVYLKDGAKWFRSTRYKDEKDRVVVRSDGRTTYFASDIAYHADKYGRGFDTVIDIWGADHHGYVPRMKAIAGALGRDPESLQLLLVHLVNLSRDGVPVAMSTRSGQFATLREVMDEVGVSAARYIFLMRNPESPLDFDLELAKRQERENPVYYIQYAHARICSILREAVQRGIGIPGPDEADLSKLTMNEEWDLVKLLVSYPEVLQSSAGRLEPHRLTFFLDSLASGFHSYYNLGWMDPAARVICDDAEVTRARLLMVRALKTVINNALGLLGVEAPEQM